MGASLKCKQGVSSHSRKDLGMCAWVPGEIPSCFREALWGSGRRPGLSGPPQPLSSPAEKPPLLEFGFDFFCKHNRQFINRKPDHFVQFRGGKSGGEKQQNVTYVQILRLT